jgi:hypothetical protein
MRTKQYTLTGLAADDDGLVTAAAPDAGTALTLEAAAADLDPPREVTLTSAGDLSAVNFTVVGLDRWGRSVSEVIVGPNANTVIGNHVYSVVTSITPDATSATTVEAGWSDRVTTPWVVTALKTGADGHALSACMVSAVDLVGAGDGDVEVTYDYPGGYVNGVIRGDEAAVPPTVDATIAVTPGTPVEAKGIMARFVLTSGAATGATIRFARPG